MDTLTGREGGGILACLSATSDIKFSATLITDVSYKNNRYFKIFNASEKRYLPSSKDD